MVVSSHRHDSQIATFLFENARDVMLVIDAEDGTIVDANRAAERDYGYTRAELLGRTIYDLRLTAAGEVTEQMRVADRRGVLFEAVHRRRDGSTFPVEVSSQGQTIGTRRTLISVIRDITERKRLEAEREALIATTQRALELRDEFLLVASHELRSPVTNVSLQLQQQLRLIERCDVRPQFVAATRAALAEVERLSDLIRTLLDAQIVRGDIVLARGPVNLVELLEDVANRFRTRSELIATTFIDVPAIGGHWDRMRLEQVFTNLLTNAHKYGRGRPIQVVAAIDGPQVHVDVRDQGIGIGRDDAARIFDKFERAVPPAYGGFGLGLYITRQLVEAHGGRITLLTTSGEGSTFRVTLPIDG
ncbi:MAG: sensor signal transduction histidine kinase [Myxococcales bacterium]|nr:sensor signal transduction histidine kinase [Myxococcales bacterium]